MSVPTLPLRKCSSTCEPMARWSASAVVRSTSTLPATMSAVDPATLRLDGAVDRAGVDARDHELEPVQVRNRVALPGDGLDLVGDLVADRGGARAEEVSGSHAVYVSRPDAVAELIARAAGR
ncbi:hypothetical protein ACGF0D_19755 [Kitasatospora sp. NPDC048298]|uniref:hypothetical protein n=1 Tax=Kitasatospora sp. NPDC048298 TaxID=3364049 RepID=UPI003711D146